MKNTHSIFLISLSVLGLMAVSTPAQADGSLAFDTGFDTGFDTSFDTGFDTGFDNSDGKKSESGSGSFSGGSIVAVGVGAFLLSQVGKKGKNSGKGGAAANSGFLSPSPAPNPTPTPVPTPSPSPSPTPTPVPPPLSLGPPTALTPEMPAGVQAIPVLLAVGGMALYQRKKKATL